MYQTKNLGINALLNVIYKGLSIIFPLITYPYALRVLGAQSIGKVNYGSSIISYFSYLAMLGIQTYAVREGSKKKDNPIEFENFASEIFTINIISALLAYVLLFVTIFSINKLHPYILLILIQSLSIILTVFSVSWINTIYEDYLIVTIRGIFCYVITIILLFVFVHNSNDYYAYAALTVVTNGIICLTNWLYCRKYVKIHFNLSKNCKKHLTSLFILFANIITITIYVNFDIIMLGWYKGDTSVGIYSVSVKIYTIIKDLLAAIYAVSIPRLALYFEQKNTTAYKQLCTDFWGYISILLIPAGIGLLCLSSEIMELMGGIEFADSAIVLKILSIALIFAIFGGITTACMNVTLGREKDNLIASLISAILNFSLNLFFIPKYAQIGAAITTVISELFVFVFCLFRIPNIKLYLDTKKIMKSICQTIIASLSIFIVSSLLKLFITSNILKIIIIIIFSVVTYFAIMIILKNQFVNAGLNIIKEKIWNTKNN